MTDQGDGTSRLDAFLEAVVIAGSPLTCVHCGSTSFDVRTALLNTRLMTYFGLDWLNEGASVYQCRGCGRLEWFVGLPEGVSGVRSDIRCLVCGETIPAAEDRCASCGWTYAADRVGDVPDA